MTGRLRFAIPLFSQFTALDAVGPDEVLQRIPTFDSTFIGTPRAGRAPITGCSAWSSTAPTARPSQPRDLDAVAVGVPLRAEPVGQLGLLGGCE